MARGRPPTIRSPFSYEKRGEGQLGCRGKRRAPKKGGSPSIAREIRKHAIHGKNIGTCITVPGMVRRTLETLRRQWQSNFLIGSVLERVPPVFLRLARAHEQIWNVANGPQSFLSPRKLSGNFPAMQLHGDAINARTPPFYTRNTGCIARFNGKTVFIIE